MLRNRDIVAIVLVLILSRMAWNDSTESLSASANLAFYFPRGSTDVVSPMDVDGDGTNEALAVVKQSKSSSSSSDLPSWVLQILDLKPLHHFSKTHLAPFQPTVLFSSEELHEGKAIPIEIAAGQVLMKKNKQTLESSKPVVTHDQELNDRNRHYFCGSDWHDASSKCGTPCPGGQAGECPGEERCFADTPCDALGKKGSGGDIQVPFQLTPGGGLPSLVTLWSNGALTLHSLTNDMSLQEDSETSKTQRKISAKKLELRLMWRVQLLPNITVSDHILWEESNVLFLDAYDSEETNSDYGTIVLNGAYYIDGEEEEGRASLVAAVDAMKGSVLWDSLTEEEKNDDERELPLPLVQGSSSRARRRSQIPQLQTSLPTASNENLPNCLFTLRRHLQQILPYSYWGPKHASLSAIHLDQKRKNKDRGHQHRGAPLDEKKEKRWHHRFHKSKHPNLYFGRPNAIVVKSRGGLQVRSLRNGMAMCHLSLLEETVYSDLNNDGIVDQVQVLTESKKADPSDRWISNLVTRLQNDRKTLKEKGANKRLVNSSPNLCHALALSGIPAMEELFSTPLCGSAHERFRDHPTATVDSVPPIVVESLSGRRNTRDIIVALNNGMVHRLHGGSGRREWELVGKYHNNFPTWEEGGNQNALLTRVQSREIASAIRPIILAGENSLAVLSVKNGGVLASVQFPQTSTSHPVLAEVSGDGTTDVMIMSTDAVWGYQILVRPGSPVVMRILVGLLIMGLMLAVLANRSGKRKDKRATDE